MIKGTVTRVIDGDTVMVLIRCRVAKGNAAPLTEHEGQLARHRTALQFQNRTVELFIHGNDEYGRALVSMRTAEDKGVRGFKTSRQQRAKV